MGFGNIDLFLLFCATHDPFCWLASMACARVPATSRAANVVDPDPRILFRFLPPPGLGWKETPEIQTLGWKENPGCRFMFTHCIHRPYKLNLYNLVVLYIQNDKVQHV